MKIIRCSLTIIAIFLITQLHGMEPEPMKTGNGTVKIQTSDEKEYEIAEKIAKYSTTLENALEVEVEEAIPLTEVSSQQWEIIAPLLLVIENKSQLQKDMANLSLENLFNAFPAVEFLNIPLLENQMIVDLAQRLTQDPNIAFRNEIDELPVRVQPDIADALLKVSGIMYSSPFSSRTLSVAIVDSVAFSPDGNYLASGSEDGIIRIWDVKTFKEINKLEGHTGWVNSVAFSPDGNYLASGSRSRDNTIRIWDVKTFKEINKLESHIGWVTSVAFSPDGNILASGSFDQTIRIWDVKTGQEINKLEGHTGSVNSVAFSPDGNLIASGSRDNTIRIWDVKTGQEINKLMGHTYWVFSVAFSPDGNYLASGSGDKTIRIWQPKLLHIFKILGAKQLAVILKVFRDQELNENEVTIYNRLPADITNIYRR